MTLAPTSHLHTSTYPAAQQAPECLCVADTQAKQEGTGDCHWGLKMLTNISRPSQCGRDLLLPFQMNITKITVDQTPETDHVWVIALRMATSHVVLCAWIDPS